MVTHKNHAIADASRAYAKAMDELPEVDDGSGDERLRVAGQRLAAALAIPEPSWTRETPTAPGMYFMRLRRRDDDPDDWTVPQVVRCYPNGSVAQLGREWPLTREEREEEEFCYEFWPVPIKPPAG